VFLYNSVNQDQGLLSVLRRRHRCPSKVIKQRERSRNLELMLQEKERVSRESLWWEREYWASGQCSEALGLSAQWFLETKSEKNDAVFVEGEQCLLTCQRRRL